MSFILASNVLCSIGRGTAQTWASARAGIARTGNSAVLNRHREPIQMGLVPEDALAPLPAAIDGLPLPARARRMLRLATPVLTGLTIRPQHPVPLLLGVPQLQLREAPWLKHFPAYLQILSSVPLDLAASAVLPLGRAAALVALQQALQMLAQRGTDAVLVGGVDTYFDPQILGVLDAEQRILGGRVMDGFIPGEGAGFLLLTRTPGAATTNIRLDAAASVEDPGHRYGDAPARGEGLAHALSMLRGQLRESAPAGVTFAGFNGESFDAKLWGVAQIRHHDFFAPSMQLEHPADKYGDLGAATGAVLCALATAALTDGSRTGPALLWAASDHATRACALVTAQRS